MERRKSLYVRDDFSVQLGVPDKVGISDWRDFQSAFKIFCAAATVKIEWPEKCPIT